MTKTKRLLFLRKGVRQALANLAEDNAKLIQGPRPTVTGLIKTLADGKWFRPDVTDVPAASLDADPDAKGSQVEVTNDTHAKLCKLAVDLGFASLESMLEDFSAGIWEIDEK